VRTLLALCLAASAAYAEPQVLRVATVAPDGTSWARDLKTFAHDVESATRGAVRIKLVFGGIAGDEDQLLGRLQRGQLDGAASGGLLCQQLAPSLHVLGVMGLIQERTEAAYVIGKLKPTVDEEMARAGFAVLAMSGMGSVMVFSRKPVTSLAELRKQRMWVWSAADESMRVQWAALGLNVMALRLDEGASAYVDGKIDGFMTTPTAALAFQWSALTRYVSRLKVAFLDGCLVMAHRALDPLPIETQRAIRAAAAELQLRFEASGRLADDQLLGGLFQKQGLTLTPVSENFRAEFFETTRALRDRLGDRAVSREILMRSLSWLADFRAESRR
jgi:TRAP-type C4-dicarboxylate transport system substrate-binding protein